MSSKPLSSSTDHYVIQMTNLPTLNNFTNLKRVESPLQSFELASANHPQESIQSSILQNRYEDSRSATMELVPGQNTFRA